jgi:SHS2 domain-containing protein
VYEKLSHTADLELIVQADTFEELVEGSILAITEEVVTNMTGENRHSFEVSAGTEEELLMKVIDEVVYLQDAEDFYPREATVSRTDGSLRVELVGGEAEVRDEIKAVTWHEFRVRQKDEKWRAHFICDV